MWLLALHVAVVILPASVYLNSQKLEFYNSPQGRKYQRHHPGFIGFQFFTYNLWISDLKLFRRFMHHYWAVSAFTVGWYFICQFAIEIFSIQL